MLIGVPKEIKDNEFRVGMTPAAVYELVHHGHQVLVERNAGLLVFGPDLERTSRWRFRLAARLVRKHAPCLVWLVSDK